MKMNRKNILIAAAVSLGGFLFGFDAAVISGVITFIVPEFDLSELQLGWVVSSLTFASTAAMLVAGPLSDRYGRKGLLVFVGLFYAASALFSALATSYEVLVIARMVGGFAVGAALVLAPLYIAEISAPETRGTMVSIQQLNIVLGFSAAYFSNYYLLGAADDANMVNLGMEAEVWRWMLGLEFIPAIMFFLAMFLVPESPRWLTMNGQAEKAREVLNSIHGAVIGKREFDQIQAGLGETNTKKAGIKDLLKPALTFVLVAGLIVGILQQITGVNAIYFYATSIFQQSGVGTDASFASAVWIGVVNVIFTIIAMGLIDKLGRKPLLLIGLVGVTLSMGLVAYGFSQATYNLTSEKIALFEDADLKEKLAPLADQAYDDDLAFKNAAKAALGAKLYAINESKLVESSISMNPILILIGILGFVASFAISLGPVMWVLLSELFPANIRGIAISFVGFINSLVSFLVQFAFPWELSNLGNAMTYAIFGLFALVGFFLVLKYVPETKGKSLEQIEAELVRA